MSWAFLLFIFPIVPFTTHSFVASDFLTPPSSPCRHSALQELVQGNDNFASKAKLFCSCSLFGSSSSGIASSDCKLTARSAHVTLNDRSLNSGVVIVVGLSYCSAMIACLRKVLARHSNKTLHRIVEETSVMEAFKVRGMFGMIIDVRSAIDHLDDVCRQAKGSSSSRRPRVWKRKASVAQASALHTTAGQTFRLCWCSLGIFRHPFQAESQRPTSARSSDDAVIVI